MPEYSTSKLYHFCDIINKKTAILLTKYHNKVIFCESAEGDEPPPECIK